MIQEIYLIQDIQIQTIMASQFTLFAMSKKEITLMNFIVRKMENYYRVDGYIPLVAPKLTTRSGLRIGNMRLMIQTVTVKQTVF